MKLENLLATAARDEASFRLLYELTVDKLFRYFVARTGGRETSLDLVQGTYVELWKGLSKFRYQSDAQFYGYLFTIARRVMIRSWRLTKYTAPMPEDFDLAAPEESKEDYRALMASVASLKGKQQLVVKLRYFSDFSYAEIASALGITENNAKVLHHRAVESLQNVKQFYA